VPENKFSHSPKVHHGFCQNPAVIAEKTEKKGLAADEGKNLLRIEEENSKNTSRRGGTACLMFARM
jgi:hypothetical protein